MAAVDTTVTVTLSVADAETAVTAAAQKLAPAGMVVSSIRFVVEGQYSPGDWRDDGPPNHVMTKVVVMFKPKGGPDGTG